MAFKVSVIHAALILVLSILILVPEDNLIAQSLIINELKYSDPLHRDEDGEIFHDWLELKNISNEAFSTENLDLIVNDTLSFQFPDRIVNPGDFLLVWITGKDRTAGELHTNFELENIAGNTFKLQNRIDLKVLDSVIVSTRLDWYDSYARYPDGGEWLLVTTRTPGQPNASFGIWKKIAASAPFMPRDAALNPSAYYKDRFWIFSGWTGDSANPSNEVWVSDDLRQWKLVNPAGPYKGTANFIVFQDKVWAFDGNAYNTVDGVAWDKVAEDLPFTTDNRIVNYRDSLWVVSGNSVFKSPDGISWDTVTTSGPWPTRVLPGFLEFKGELYLFGGAEYHQASHPAHNDVWRSKDGATWELVTDNAPWPGRAWFAHTVFEDKIWMFSGFDYWTQDDINDVWYSEDGVNWTQLKSSNVWTNRHAPYHWVARGSLWISSGYNTVHYGLYNDAWRLDPEYLDKQDEFFLIEDMPLTDPYSWSSTLDGNGFIPKGFDLDNQIFTITSGQHELGVPWSVSGTNTYVRLGNGTEAVEAHISEPNTFDAPLVLDSAATLVLSNAASPTILEAHADSKVVVTAENLRLDSAELGNLVVQGVNLTGNNVKVKNSITIEDGNIADQSNIYLNDGVTVRYNSTKGSVHIFDFFQNDRANVIIDCDCEVKVFKDILIDTLQLLSGTLSVRGSELNIGTILQGSPASSISMDASSIVTLDTHDGEAFFPIGMEKSYNPIWLKGLTSTQISAQVSAPDYMECVSTSVNVNWKLFSSELNEQVDVGLQWDSAKEGRFFQRNYAVIKQLTDSEWKIPEPDTADIFLMHTTQHLAAKTSLPYETTFVVQNEKGCFANDQKARIVVFPNPAQGKFYLRPRTHRTLIEEVEILDMAGRVLDKTYTEGDDHYEVNIGPNIKPGLYLLRIKANAGTFYERLKVK